MAKQLQTVLLGFEDELITEKHKGLVNFTTNKIGGKPDLPSNIKLDPPLCPLCQLTRPLITQIYAPLENLTSHRTLYLFACINPNCWGLSESWVCIRVQSQEKIKEVEESSSTGTDWGATDWCSDADNWDDNNSNVNEENGNVINNVERISDEDDESCSLEESLRSGFGNLAVDERNANTGAQGGAVGRQHSPMATAEIEGDEGEVITVDTPTMPQHDLAALLNEATPLPQEICLNMQSDSKKPLLQFVAYFMSVWEEVSSSTTRISDRHVKDLLLDYQKRNEDVNLDSPDGGGGGDQSDVAFEKYEKSNPAHGDKMFHHFLSKIQSNPGQILRYCRESEPLLLHPLHEIPKHCQYCKGDMVFELQLIPTIISKLTLVSDAKHLSRLEFGTVLVFTCRKSCWSKDSNAKIETVILQQETY